MGAQEQRWFAALLTVTAVLAVVQLIWALLSVAVPHELEYGESIIHDQAWRIVQGEPLYQDYSHAPFTVVIYTPLYYVAVAGLQAVFGPGFLPGRALSLTASLVATASVFLMTARLAHARAPGLLAAFLFFSVGLGGGAAPLGALLGQLSTATAAQDPTPIWGALYKEDALGVAFALSAITLLARGGSTRTAAVAGVLAAFAFLTKQTLVASSIAGCLWLLQINRRAALVFTAVDLLIVAATALTVEFTTAAFVQNLLLANLTPIRLSAFAYNAKIWAVFQLGIAISAAIYVRTVARARLLRGPIKLVVIYWLATLVSVAGLVKVGSNYNYWIELAAPTACLASLSVWNAATAARSPSWRDVLPFAAVSATVGLVGLLLGPVLVQASFSRASHKDDGAEFAALVSRVKSEPKEVLASPLDVVTLARRHVLFEYWTFAIWSRQGLWDSSPITQRICNGDVGLLVLNFPVDQPAPEFQDYSAWPTGVLDALRRAAVLDDYTAGRYVYRLDRPCSASAGFSR